MDDLFTALAPRRGTRPLLGHHAEIGVSSLSGGAINWGNLWSGLKNFGSTVKNYGQKVWNSSTGQALRQKLKDTDLQGKVVEGLSTGIHGAVDLARQELDRQLASRLDLPPPPPPDVEVEPPAPTESVEMVDPSKVALEDTKKRPPTKRPLPRDEEDMGLPPPPAYDELYPEGPPLVPTTKEVKPTTRPIASMATPVRPSDEPRSLQSLAPSSTTSTAVPAPPNVFRRPSSRFSGWHSTLSGITGLGVRAFKRRRCFR